MMPTRSRVALLASVLATPACHGGSADDADASDADGGASQGGSGSSSASSATVGSGASFSATGDDATGGSSASSASDSDGSTGDPTGDPDPDPSTDCAPLPAPEGAVVMVSPSEDLASAIAAAPAGTTLVLADGSYDVSGASYIVFAADGVTLRSASGDPDAVIIDGGYGIGEVFSIVADDITIAEVTIRRAINHPIHVTGGADSNTQGTVIYRVHVIDPGQQAIKINASNGFYADDGEVACSSIEMTDEGRTHVTDCYTGGIDAHLARGWVVRDNTIRGFWCEAGLSEHAVHVWNSGRDTVVERNLIIDCARGVGFGLGENGNGTSRDYGDDPCPGVQGFVGHYGGVVRNNMIVGASPSLFASQFGMDSGVALEQACGATVVHNTVVALQQPFVSMEYRFGNTSAQIVNNLVSHSITMRDGGTATLDGNLEQAATSQFVDAAAGDLHLVPGASAIDAGVAAGGIADDYDRDARDGAPDVGADEWMP